MLNGLWGKVFGRSECDACVGPGRDPADVIGQIWCVHQVRLFGQTSDGDPQLGEGDVFAGAAVAVCDIAAALRYQSVRVVGALQEAVRVERVGIGPVRRIVVAAVDGGGVQLPHRDAVGLSQCHSDRVDEGWALGTAWAMFLALLGVLAYMVLRRRG